METVGGGLIRDRAAARVETVLGRQAELRRIRAAIHKRQSLLIWGPADAGKTAVVQEAIAELPERERRNGFYWSGAASRKQWVSHVVGGLYAAGDSFVRGKAGADGATEASLNQWLNRQSSLRLRGILFTAAARGKYRLFLDHFPPPTPDMTRLLKEMMYRCKTPVYLCARGYSQAAIGHAWSLYWNDELRVYLGPLTERAARDLLEICIERYGLVSLELTDFRKELLCRSNRFAGSIVKMCELAADPRYRQGRRIKVQLVHVDYLMRSRRGYA